MRCSVSVSVPLLDVTGTVIAAMDSSVKQMVFVLRGVTKMPPVLLVRSVWMGPARRGPVRKPSSLHTR